MDHIIEVVVKVSAAARVILLRELYAQRSHVAFVPTTTTSFVLEWCENRVMKCGEANNDDRHVYYWDAVDSCECCVRCQNSKWSCHTVYNADTLNTFETRWMSFLFVSCITFRAFWVFSLSNSFVNKFTTFVMSLILVSVVPVYCPLRARFKWINSCSATSRGMNGSIYSLARSNSHKVKFIFQINMSLGKPEDYLWLNVFTVSWFMI